MIGRFGVFLIGKGRFSLKFFNHFFSLETITYMSKNSFLIIKATSN